MGKMEGKLVCSSPGCNKPASNLACPNCKKFGLNNYFCGQECFKKNYAAHKQVHAIAKQMIAANGGQLNDGVSCSLDSTKKEKEGLPVWAKGYSFSGPLRPALHSPKRTLPRTIRRPDYADHPAGVSESEERDKR